MALTSQQVQELRHRILERRRQLAAEIRGDAERARGETFGALAGETHDTAEESVADLFADLDQAEMNRDLADTGGSVLVVSQFTLYGDASKGRRPSFIGAAPPNIAIPLYETFVALLREKSGGKIPVETGEFGAMMDVELVNDGPVTFVLDSRG